MLQKNKTNSIVLTVYSFQIFQIFK